MRYKVSASSSLKDTDTQTRRGRGDSSYSNSSRRYDCEQYLDCLFQASIANMRALPCKDCDKYVSRAAEEEGNQDLGLWA